MAGRRPTLSRLPLALSIQMSFKTIIHVEKALFTAARRPRHPGSRQRLEQPSVCKFVFGLPLRQRRAVPRHDVRDTAQRVTAQIEALGDRDPALKKTVEDFRADEAAHRQTALDHGAEQAPGYRLLNQAIKAGCRVAIKLSEKI